MRTKMGYDDGPQNGPGAASRAWARGSWPRRGGAPGWLRARVRASGHAARSQQAERLRLAEVQRPDDLDEEVHEGLLRGLLDPGGDVRHVHGLQGIEHGRLHPALLG